MSSGEQRSDDALPSGKHGMPWWPSTKGPPGFRKWCKKGLKDCSEYFEAYQRTFKDLAIKGELPPCFRDTLHMTDEKLKIWTNGTHEDKHKIWHEMKKEWKNCTKEQKQEKKDCLSQCRQTVSSKLTADGVVPSERCQELLNRWRERRSNKIRSGKVDEDECRDDPFAG